MYTLPSLVGRTLIIGAKESGETHAKVVSHNGMLSCQQIRYSCDVNPLNICTMQLNVNY